MVEELKEQSGSLTAIKCDVTKDDQVLSMFSQIKRDLGGVDVCINNAGMAHKHSLLGEIMPVCSERRYIMLCK